MCNLLPIAKHCSNWDFSEPSGGNLLKCWSLGSFQESVLNKIFDMDVPLLLKGRGENTLACWLVG